LAGPISLEGQGVLVPFAHTLGGALVPDAMTDALMAPSRVEASSLADVGSPVYWT
jgi:hypothetical protein